MLLQQKIAAAAEDCFNNGRLLQQHKTAIVAEDCSAENLQRRKIAIAAENCYSYRKLLRTAEGCYNGETAITAED